MKKQRILIVLFFVVLSLVINLFITRNYHIGVSPDSVLYIEEAKNFSIDYKMVDREGNLVNHVPPLYPVALALFCKLIGADILNGADYLAALLIALSIFVANLLFIKLKLSNRAVILLNLFLVFSPAFDVFRMLWSETLFIFFLLTAVYFLYRWMEAGRVLLIILCGLFSGMLVLTRYAGIGLIGGMMLYLLIGIKKPLPFRVKLTAFYTLFVAAVVAVWVFIALSNSSNPTNRTLSFHLISVEHIIDFIATMAKWLSPSFLPGMILVAGTVLLLVVRLLQKKINPLHAYRDQKYQLLIYMVCAYLIFLVCSISIIDFSTPLDNRILSPVYPLCLILVAPFAGLVKDINPRLGYALTLVILIFYARGFFVTARTFMNEGREFTGKIWTGSPLLKSLQVAPPTKVYANAEDLLKLWKPANVRYLPLPMEEDPNKKKSNSSFSAEMSKMKEAVLADSAIVVFFDNITWRPYYPEKEELKNFFSGCRIDQYDDGIVISVGR